MSFSAFGLLIAAALLHVSWNFIFKRSGGKLTSLWWGFVIGSVVCFPILIIGGGIPPRIWPYAFASALFEAVYISLLAWAYQAEDFSLVYPIARGAAPAFLGVWSIVFLKETPSLAGKIGLLIITGGLMIVGSNKWLGTRKHGVGSLAGVGLAGLVAITISIYSAIDGAAVKVMDAVPYTVLTFILTSFFAAPVVFGRFGWKMMKSEWKGHWLQSGAIGLLSLAAYGLVLIVYRFTPVSYAGAIREISIVFGALAGWLWLGEDFGMLRVIGSVVMFAGILTILIAG